MFCYEMNKDTVEFLEVILSFDYDIEGKQGREKIVVFMS